MWSAAAVKFVHLDEERWHMCRSSFTMAPVLIFDVESIFGKSTFTVATIAATVGLGLTIMVGSKACRNYFMIDHQRMVGFSLCSIDFDSVLD